MQNNIIEQNFYFKISLKKEGFILKELYICFKNNCYFSIVKELKKETCFYSFHTFDYKSLDESDYHYFNEVGTVSNKKEFDKIKKEAKNLLNCF